MKNHKKVQKAVKKAMEELMRLTPEEFQAEIDQFKDDPRTLILHQAIRQIQPTPECCDFGEYKCQIPMPIKGRVQYIDRCIAPIVAALNAANIVTVASCCGHNKIPGSIILDDDTELTISKFDSEKHHASS